MAARIVAEFETLDRVTVRGVGAGAVNQALKGTILARQRLAGRGEDMVLIPGFANVDGYDGNAVSAIVLHCVLAQSVVVRKETGSD